MMKWCLLFVTLLGSFLVFMLWLGWGHSGQWDEVIGWTQLSESELLLAEQSADEFTKLENRPNLYWGGHATIQIVWGGLRLVADPVASTRVKVAPRMFDGPILAEGLVSDAILLTHAHMDHLDNATLERLSPTRLYLPSGSERFLSGEVLARHEVVPLQIGEVARLGDIEIIPVPAQHGGWRYPWQRGLFACGYMIRHQGEALYLAGDTAMGEHFEAIAADYAPRFAVLPIGAYSPQWFLRSRHLNPVEALKVAGILNCEFVIPYHFGTFRLSLDPIDQPLKRWATAAFAAKQQWFLPIASSD